MSQRVILTWPLGFDDYPRAGLANPILDAHVDLTSWILFAADSLIEMGMFLDRNISALKDARESVWRTLQGMENQ